MPPRDNFDSFMDSKNTAGADTMHDTVGIVRQLILTGDPDYLELENSYFRPRREIDYAEASEDSLDSDELQRDSDELENSDGSEHNGGYSDQLAEDGNVETAEVADDDDDAQDDVSNGDRLVENGGNIEFPTQNCEIFNSVVDEKGKFKRRFESNSYQIKFERVVGDLSIKETLLRANKKQEKSVINIITTLQAVQFTIERFFNFAEKIGLYELFILRRRVKMTNFVQRIYKY